MHHVASLLAGWLLLVAAWALPLQAAEEKTLIAVLDLEGVKADEAETFALTERLREEMLRSGRFVLVDRSQMDAVLNEQALQQSGCTEQECAVQVGQILGVRRIVAGKVIKVSDTVWLVSGIMVDVESAQTLRAESVQHRGDFFALMGDGVTSLATKLAGLATTSDETPRSAKAAPLASMQPAPPGPESPEREPTTATHLDDTEGMVLIRGGEFSMGRAAGLFESKNTEPVHLVRVSDFRIDAHEVTHEEFAAVMRSSLSQHDEVNLPVNGVTWAEAQAYCKKVGKRLPTEAEWEYAARAGTQSRYFWGADDDEMPRFANYCGPKCATTWSGTGEQESDGVIGLAPVGAFAPNPWQLYDMYGNVSEWVADWDGRYLATSETDPRGPEVGTGRVVRGGSFKSALHQIDSTVRESVSPERRDNTIGLRCAADIR